MGHVELPQEIWEPAAGKRAIVDVLEAGGHSVLATDKFDHGASGIITGQDFLAERPIAHPRCIVTNPPFNIAPQFVERALDVADVSYFLLRMQFVNRGTSRHLMKHMTGFFPFAPRPPRMHADGWEGPRAGGTGDYAWFRFSRHTTGICDCRPIYWRDYVQAPTPTLTPDLFEKETA
tara:strand:- start:488 stop:1018 length:531 start_codon:yes stop_codon:yes gene_type:complete